MPEKENARREHDARWGCILKKHKPYKDKTEDQEEHRQKHKTRDKTTTTASTYVTNMHSNNKIIVYSKLKYTG